MLTFSRKPLGIWLVSAFVLGASFLTSLFLSDTAFAATGAWKNSTTITVNGVDYTGGSSGFLVQCTTSTSSSFKVFRPASGAARVYFDNSANLATATSGYFSQTGKFGSPCEEKLTLTNTQSTAGTGTGTGTSTGTTDTDTTTDTCNITNIGWIVCPVSLFLAKVTDGIYMAVENLLVFRVAPNPLDTSSANPVYTIWSNIRNLANIAFIFAFFAIIFSQATSIGLASYGIKKMLPRLIVAAILVNLSYYICVFAVDLSNIVGAGIDGIIKSVPLEGSAGTSSDRATAAGTWTGIITPLLAVGIAGSAMAGTTFIGAVFAALPFLVIALFAVLTALVVLLARQAILIILIVIAPLAFVAYILPNTEDSFNKWKKLFTAMLVFYPLVAIIFAGSQVAASILRLTANTGDFSDQMIKVMSLAVQVFPLFALPFILKFSGGVLGRLAGAINNPNKGPFDSLRKRAEMKRDTVRGKAQARAAGKAPYDFTTKKNGKRRRLGGAYTAIANSNPMSSRVANKNRIDREHELENAKNLKARAESSYYTGKVSTDDGYADRMAGGTMFTAPDPQDVMRVRTGAQAAERKAFQERVGAYQTSFSLTKQGADTSAGGFLESQFDEAVRMNNAEQASAVLNRMSGLGAGGREAVRRVMEKHTIKSPDMQLAISNSIYEDNFGSLVTKVGDVAKGKFDAHGKWDMTASINNVGTEQLASQDLNTLLKYEHIISPKEAHRIVHDTELQSKVQSSDHLEVLERIASNYTPPPQGQTAQAGGPAGGGSPAGSAGTGAGSGPGGNPSPGAQSGGGGYGNKASNSAASMAAAAAAGAAAGTAAGAAAGRANASQMKPGMFDAYSTPTLQQLSAADIRNFASSGGGSVSQLDGRDLDRLVDALKTKPNPSQDQQILLTELQNEQTMRVFNQQSSTFVDNKPIVNQVLAPEQQTQRRDQQLGDLQAGIRDIDRNIGLGRPWDKPNNPNTPPNNNDNDNT